MCGEDGRAAVLLLEAVRVAEVGARMPARRDIGELVVVGIHAARLSGICRGWREPPASPLAIVRLASHALSPHARAAAMRASSAAPRSRPHPSRPPSENAAAFRV